MTLPGGDSATPKPDRYAGKKVWGVYVAGATFHVWTRGEVNQLDSHGIEGVIPIVVPPQDREWWTEGEFGYPVLEALVREARAWGIPKGSPICLDVEEGQSSRMASPADVCHAWAVACSVHHMRAWTYGSLRFLLNDRYAHRWLAQWPTQTPTHPQLPQGFAGWQYHGEDNGIDHDIFQEGRTYLSPHLELVTLPHTGHAEPHFAPEAVTSEPAASGPSPESQTSPAGAAKSDPEANGTSAATAATPPMTGTPPEAGSGSLVKGENETAMEVDQGLTGGGNRPAPDGRGSQPKGNQVNISISPALVAFFNQVENFVRKTGMWTILVNDFTHTFGVSNTYGLKSVLTGVAALLLWTDHKAAKVKPAP